MKLIQLLLVTVILVVGISACQKEISTEDLLNPPPPANTVVDSNYLDKIYIVNVSGGTSDTDEIVTYHYDNLKRVSSIKDSIKYNPTEPFKPWQVMIYQYNGSDSVPFRTVDYQFEEAIVFNNMALLDTTTIFHKYDASSKNLTDSSIFAQHFGGGAPGSPFNFTRYREVETYHYQGNNIYRKSFVTPIASNFPTPTDIQEQRDTAVTDGNGNLLNAKRYIINNNISTLELESVFTYDNKINPFFKLSNFKALKLFPVFETNNAGFQTKNNILHAIQTDAGGNVFDQDFTGKYSYSNDGYPTRLIQEFPQAGIIYHVIFTYKSL